MSSAHRLLIVSLFHPDIVRGGAQQVAYNLFREARADPDVHATLLCACDPAHNPALLKSGAFITGFEGRTNEHLFFGHGFDFFLQRATNPLAVSRFREFIREVRPDTVHLHHTLFVGAPLISVIRQECPDARILFTFHEFIPICHANGQMIRTNGGQLCYRSSPYRCHECFPTIAPDAFTLRKRFLLRSFEDVDAFIAPTSFLRDRYVEWGIDGSRIHVIPNGQPPVECQSSSSQHDETRRRNRFGFFGQLIDNKGLHVLLEAARHLAEQGITDFSVDINGANLEYATPTYRATIQDEMDRLSALGSVGVRQRGSYDHSQLPMLMSRVDWVVVPSTWWEIFGLVVSEAWAFGKPVIASDIGGLRERVRHGGNGFLFPVADAEALASTMKRCIEEGVLWPDLHNQCRPEMTSYDAWCVHRRLMSPSES